MIEPINTVLHAYKPVRLNYRLVWNLIIIRERSRGGRKEAKGTQVKSRKRPQAMAGLSKLGRPLTRLGNGRRRKKG
ncbi:hypothetical protein EUGRSUZ_G03201 [Eucalyptus grandis]|uniref:Uncharacterized protein n=2 Tax=Eucalyptus grandis TaxID=71139 RepID=A0ACC3K9U4_EUCGR|nr:hypothetical protein EUGRSUZ_G03201 [Eucalyptus grandis]